MEVVEPKKNCFLFIYQFDKKYFVKKLKIYIQKGREKKNRKKFTLILLKISITAVVYFVIFLVLLGIVGYFPCPLSLLDCNSGLSPLLTTLMTAFPFFSFLFYCIFMKQREEKKSIRN